MNNEDFFDECTLASKTKQFIIRNYFASWASIMLRVIGNRGFIAYIDLFSGPGVYEDGTESTPISICNLVLNDQDFKNRIHIFFNDKKSEYIDRLTTNIGLIPNIGTLRYPPKIMNFEVDTSLVTEFNAVRFVPSFLFVDPCGYDGFSLDLVWSVIKDFGCDCLAFFNYSRFNMHLENPKIPRESLNEVLNCDTVALSDELIGMTPLERENKIISTIEDGAHQKGIDYILTFKFKSLANRTSHFLLFFTKHFLGYDTMKKVMYKTSIKDENGVALYQFDYTGTDQEQMSISFDFENKIGLLKGTLLTDYRGCVIKFKELYESHSVGKPFIESQYKQVLREMMLDKSIHTNRVPKTGFPDDIEITFPKE